MHVDTTVSVVADTIAGAIINVVTGAPIGTVTKMFEHENQTQSFNQSF